MWEFNPGEQKTAIVPMTNPTSKAFDYTAELYMGTDLALMAREDFHLEAGQSKDISLPVTMPTVVGTYPVNIGVFSGGEFIPPVHKGEDVVIVSAKGLITLYATGLRTFYFEGGYVDLYDPITKTWSTVWYPAGVYADWYADWYYAGEGYRVNLVDYYSNRGLDDACTPPKPIDLNNLIFTVDDTNTGGWRTWGPFGPFVVKDGGTYTIDIPTGVLTEGRI